MLKFTYTDKILYVISTVEAWDRSYIEKTEPGNAFPEPDITFERSLPCESWGTVLAYCSEAFGEPRRDPRSGGHQMFLHYQTESTAYRIEVRRENLITANPEAKTT